jgi:serine phosphatase RsbU (regulator of sigma subunit)
MKKSTTEIVFENLIAFAYSDGLDERERDFLYHFAEEKGIPEDQVKETIERRGEIVIPDDADTKQEILNYMIDLAMVDGNFSVEELQLCNKFVEKLGLDASMMILTTKLLTSLNEIDEQKKIIAEKNKDIQDSLEAAKIIQTAILPPPSRVNSILNNSFVMYLPKDIVSGDFYWVEPLNYDNRGADDNTVFVSAVDCTGHGVPGAFMSIVGHNGLNRTLKEFKLEHPGEMLEKLNFIVGESLNEGENLDVKNGMDIALCKLNKKSLELEYAGAMNSLYLVRNCDAPLKASHPIEDKRIHRGENCTMYEIKADRDSIGANCEEAKFTNHYIQLEKGDAFYIASDGFVDQNGGEKDKKFRPQPFRKMLMEIQDLSLVEQKKKILGILKEWMGDREQRDDIVLIGVKV